MEQGPLLEVMPSGWKIAAVSIGAWFAVMTGLYFAIAQPVTTLALSGNEAINFAVGGPGGTGGVTTVYALRNACNYQAVGTGGTVNTTVLPTTCKLIATGAITTWNITMPTAPYDTQIVAVSCPGGTATTVAVTYTPGTLSGSAFTACTAGGAAANGAEWIYSASNTTWNRIQ